ncbi:LPXTG-motif cell wall anchor domain-containing protein [Micromonospora viridifaciens]|uniref:LPXTG-motif cell wall anchor domain-containing protein n=1 Tax=Micromonospora viridifaciens TaxID=1881 RepID=A0A1C4U197_MICVI|nr:LPXTG cell wall anchor domain-containing protein [Micromonospora viridifaciens]SCE65488.1 LPXTG-motif cell wall anchor domain-containing protein [Micromonospora viridifaciens]
MTFFHRAALARAGAAAVLAVGGLTAVSSPAHAADLPDLVLMPISTSLAKGVEAAQAKPFKFTVRNVGTATAKDVSVRVKTDRLKPKRVGYVVPDGCQVVADQIYDCRLGDLPAGTSEDFGIPLFSTGGKGDGGVLTVGVATTSPEPNPADEFVDVPIQVTSPGYDLTAWAQDIQDNVVVDGARQDEPDLKPVRPGVTVPLDWAVYNDGSKPATGVFYGITLPAGVSFVDLPESCVRQEILGKAQALCEDDGAVVKPGQYYTADVKVRVGTEVTEPVLHEGDLFAYGLDRAEGQPEETPRVATSAQRKAFTEVDGLDNHTTFEAFVDLSTEPSPDPSGTPTSTPTPTPTGTAQPSPSGQPSVTPTSTPTPGGGSGGGSGDGGGLPVTGMQVGLIGGIGAAVLLAGGALLFLSRRRRVVLVPPGDETSGD